MINSGVPYGFVCSACPLMLNLDGYPRMGSDCRLDDVEHMRKFAEEFEPHRVEMRKALMSVLEKRGIQIDQLKFPIDQARSDHFSIYSYPKEIDYYDEQVKQKYKLWPIDTPLTSARIPKPFVLPKEFAELPEKLCTFLWVLCSAYTPILFNGLWICSRNCHTSTSSPKE